MNLDRSPIDQRWIQKYCDEFLKIAGEMPTGVMRDAILRRVECAMDLVEAWQKRNQPIEALAAGSHVHKVSDDGNATATANTSAEDSTRIKDRDA